MDGLKSSRDAMAILNQPSDLLTITTLKWGSGLIDYKKTTHAATQTESLLREGMLLYYRDDNRTYLTINERKYDDS